MRRGVFFLLLESTDVEFPGQERLVLSVLHVEEDLIDEDEGTGLNPLGCANLGHLRLVLTLLGKESPISVDSGTGRTLRME